MASGLAVTLFGGLVLVGVVVATREPSEPAAVGGLLLGLGLVAAALVAAASYYRPRGRRLRPRPLGALRRGAVVGAAVSTLALLRVIDALTLVTAAFVVAAAAALESGLSARR